MVVIGFWRTTLQRHPLNWVLNAGIRYVEGFAPPNFADLVANAPFSE
jgi:hypothetical protein